jgi:hypothetical protein
MVTIMGTHPALSVLPTLLLPCPIAIVSGRIWPPRVFSQQYSIAFHDRLYGFRPSFFFILRVCPYQPSRLLTLSQRYFIPSLSARVAVLHLSITSRSPATVLCLPMVTIMGTHPALSVLSTLLLPHPISIVSGRIWPRRDFSQQYPIAFHDRLYGFRPSLLLVLRVCPYQPIRLLTLSQHHFFSSLSARVAVPHLPITSRSPVLRLPMVTIMGTHPALSVLPTLLLPWPIAIISGRIWPRRDFSEQYSIAFHDRLQGFHPSFFFRLRVCPYQPSRLLTLS